MDELGCLLSNQENVDELKQKLYYTTMERDALKVQATEQLMKHQQHEAQLLMLLEMAYRERDETNNHLQKLLGKMTPAKPDDLNYQGILPPGDAKAIPSITESNSLSNHHSNGDSLLDGGVSSSELSGISMADSRRVSIIDRASSGSVIAKFDPTDVVMEHLAKGLTLPPKGKLLSAVIQAGPPLKSLLVAGPLPMWKNPPPIRSLRIPRELQTSAIGISANNKLKELQPQFRSLRNCSASLLDFRCGNSCDVRTFSLRFNALNEVHHGSKRQRIQ